MSEGTENTQPPKEDTQPIKVQRKAPRWRSMLVSALGVIVLLLLGGLGGYGSGIGVRKAAEAEVISQQLTEQFQYALVDIQFSHYDSAKQRLEFIIRHDPTYPGAADKLAEVLVLMTIPTATPTPTITPTPDLRGVESLFATAQQLIAAQDWPNALAALDQLRKQDRNYKTSQVDGMYYFALRNYGANLIAQQGNLEGGIYQLSLAERFAPLDREANGLREGARLYIVAASFWEVNWKQAVFYLSQLNSGWPSLWDGTMTASQRYFIALMRYGDELFSQNQFCDAYAQYQSAMAMGTLDQKAARNANQAYQECYPPTETPTPTEIIIVLPTDTPTGVPPSP